ncbi:TPA: hypothetical protein DIC40_04390 [Patescibacteria group bacterium]|nr:hypothetical protein [Candidatus Gracilibacteria bacterium]
MVPVVSSSFNCSNNFFNSSKNDVVDQVFLDSVVILYVAAILFANNVALVVSLYVSLESNFIYTISPFFTVPELVTFVSLINNVQFESVIGILVFVLNHQITISFEVYSVSLFAFVTFVNINWFGVVSIVVVCCDDIVIVVGVDRELVLFTLS